MRAVRDITRGGRGIGFLDEARDLEGALDAGQGLALGDVAIAGFRGGGLHAEGDDMAGARRGGGGAQRGGECFGVGDSGVGGHDPEHAVGVFLRREDAGDRDRRCAVAADRLEQDARPRDAGIAQLLGDDEAVVVVGDHDRGGEPAADRPTGGFLQQGLLGEERPELLRIAFPRDRPEPRAGAAGQDDRHDCAGDRGEGGGWRRRP